MISLDHLPLATVRSWSSLQSLIVCVVKLITETSGTSRLLEIAMDDFLLMQEGEALQNLPAPGL